MSVRTKAALVLSVLLLSACANYTDQLARAEHHYQNARYEAALVNLEDLDVHVAGLGTADRVRYDYVRGMTHLRLEQREDARHYLALAREEAREAPAALTEEMRQTVERYITELDPLNPQSGSSATPASGSSAAPASSGSASSTPSARN